MENLLYQCLWGQLSATCSNATEVAQFPNRQYLVAVDPSQVRTMASERFDQIDLAFSLTFY